LGDFLRDTEREDVSCLSGAVVLGLRVPKLAGYGFEEVTAPNANQQSGPEEDYGVKASEVAAGPIGTLLDAQPEREFVQSKSGGSRDIKRLTKRDEDSDPSPTSINQKNPTASRRRMPQTSGASADHAHASETVRRGASSSGAGGCPQSSIERRRQVANFSLAWSRYLLPPDGILRAGRIQEVYVTAEGRNG
jgi:hypothetical protein